MANRSEPQFRMQIETQLQEDHTGALKSTIGSGLSEYAAAIDAELRKGVAPEEYRRLTAVKKGLDAASLILRRTWSYYHP